MLPRPMRTPIALLATLGLLMAMTAIPVAADAHDVCDAADQTSGQVAEDVTITYDSLFVCTDAAASGTWSITVEIANDADSTADVTIDGASLSHTSPRPGGEGPEATAETEDLPLTVEPGVAGTIGIGGDYELVSTDDGDEKAILHLRLSGTAGDALFMLGVNVQILAPGVDPDLDDPEEIDDPNGDGDGDGAAAGRPEWVPGPPPWVRELLEAIFSSGFPWGTDDFPPGRGADDENGDADADGEGRPSWVPGPPPWAPGPPDGVPPANGADENGDAEAETDDGPPDFVRPGGPPSTIPGPGRP